MQTVFSDDETELSRAHDVAQWSFVYDCDGNTYALLWKKEKGDAFVPGDGVHPGCYRYPDEVLLWPLVDPDTGETYRRYPSYIYYDLPKALDPKRLYVIYPGQPMYPGDNVYLDYYMGDQKIYNDYVLETCGVKRLMLEPNGDYNYDDDTCPLIDEVTEDTYTAYYDPPLDEEGNAIAEDISFDCLVRVENNDTGEVLEPKQVEIYESPKFELFFDVDVRRAVLAKAKLAAQKAAEEHEREWNPYYDEHVAAMERQKEEKEAQARRHSPHL